MAELDEDIFLQCCKTLKKLLGKNQPDLQIGHFRQRYRTCAASSLEAAMLWYGSEDTQQRVVEVVRSGVKAILTRIPKSPHSVVMKTNRLIALKILKALPRDSKKIWTEVGFVSDSELASLAKK